ncbi:MAG: ThiF family adenylyltransferase, partial [Nanoarchaeota archaeon]
MKTNYIRQLTIFNPEDYKNLEISIVGCGSVGSFTALALAKMGMKKFSLWDFDKVRRHNLPNQFYMEKHLNTDKTESLIDLIRSFISEVKLRNKGKLTNKSIILSDIVILTTDTMASRKLAYEKAKLFSRYLIDARMGGQVMVIYTVDLKNPEQVKNYEKTLHSDKDAEDIKCTEKSIIYNVLGVGSMICNQLKKQLNKETYQFMLSLDYHNLILL